MDAKFDNRVTVVPYIPDKTCREEDQRVVLVVLKGTRIGQLFPLEKGLTLIGRDDAATIQLMDADVSRRHASIQWHPETECFQLQDLGSSNGTRLNDALLTGEHEIVKGDKIQLGLHAVLRVCYGDEVETEYARAMYQAALRDGLTGAYNRRYLDDRLAAEVSFAIRHQAQLTFILLDIDHFKKINDTYGHPTGDAILRLIACLIEDNIRTEDIFARYGGEEFAIVCRNTPENGAVILAERIRSSLDQREYMIEDRSVRVTVSFGVAELCGIDPPLPQSLIDAADKALYQAKQQGRNSVVPYSSLIS